MSPDSVSNLRALKLFLSDSRAPLPKAVTGSAGSLHHQPLRFFNSAQAAVITAMAERC